MRFVFTYIIPLSFLHFLVFSFFSGVPQGSVLGPLFFVLLLSDLPSLVSGLSALFADDTLANDRCDGSPSDKSSSCCRLQHDFTSIHQWSNEWARSSTLVSSLTQRCRGHHTLTAQTSFFSALNYYIMEILLIIITKLLEIEKRDCAWGGSGW